MHTQFVESAALIAIVEFVAALIGFFALGHAVAFKTNQQLVFVKNYSCRKASAGDTEAAERAGQRLAPMATSGRSSAANR